MATSTRPFPLPDDILTAILELARQQRGNASLEFAGHDEDLQDVFFELCKNKKHSLLGSFVFSDAGPRPYSPALSDSVSKLQLAGLVGRKNPDYEVVFTTPAARGYYEAVLSKRFSGEEKNQLNEIANEFLARIHPM